MITNMCDMVFATKDKKTTSGKKNVFDSTTITCSCIGHLQLQTQT